MKRTLKEMRSDSNLDDYFGFARQKKMEDDGPIVEVEEDVPAEVEMPPPLHCLNSHVKDSTIMRHPDPTLHVYLFKYTTQEPQEDGTVVDREHTHRVSMSGSQLKKFFFPEFDPVKVTDGMFRKSKCEESLIYRPMNPSPYAGKTREQIIKGWEDGADAGTAFHFCVENYLNRYYNNLLAGTLAEQLDKFLTPEEDKPKYVAQEKKARLFFSFLRTFLSKGWKPYRVEWIVYHREMDIAGAIDAVFYRTANGVTEYAIVDWKTVAPSAKKKLNTHVMSAFYNNMCYYPIQHLKANRHSEYCVQLHFYAYVLRNFYNIPVKKCIAVCVSDTEIEDYDLPEVDIAALLAMYRNKLELEKKIADWYENPEAFSDLPSLLSPLHFD